MATIGKWLGCAEIVINAIPTTKNARSSQHERQERVMKSSQYRYYRKKKHTDRVVKRRWELHQYHFQYYLPPLENPPTDFTRITPGHLRKSNFATGCARHRCVPRYRHEKSRWVREELEFHDAS